MPFWNPNTPQAGKFDIQFKPSGRGKAQCPPDPQYPTGKDIRMPSGFGCIVKLPYPAPECGVHVVRCTTCEASCAVTAAGRPDDPKTIQMACRGLGVKQ